MHRRAQSEERRRRVLKDDVSAAEAIGPGLTSSGKTSTCAAEYKISALQDQLRISDVVPRAMWAHLLVFVGGASMVGGLLWAHDRLDPIANPQYAVFNLLSTGSLASWFAAFALLLVTGSAIVCFSLRRQKLTDYHNRYRVWLWTAMFSLFASVAATTSWPTVAAHELARVAPWNLSEDGLLWWLIPCVFVLGVMSMRLILEMRSSRLATVGLMFSLACYTTVISLKLWQPSGIRTEITTLIEVGSLLAGHLLLFSSFLWYARYTVAVMQGRVTAPASKRAVQKETGNKSVRGDEQHATTPTPKRRTDCEPQDATLHSQRIREEAEREQERYEEQEGRSERKTRSRRRPQIVERDEQVEMPMMMGKKMTKADRKRQRKLKAHQREAA